MATRFNPIQLSDFTGGLNTKTPSNELTLRESPDLDNLLLLPRGFEKRTGDSEFNSTAMNSGADVQGLAYYKESGGNEYLVAIAGAKMYKSDSLDGTMDEISADAGATPPSANQNNIYTPVILNNILVWFGPTAPTQWDGSTATNDYFDLGGGSPTADFAFVMKDRCFAGRTTANPSTLYWSVLSDITDWSGTGSGSQTFETNDGDNLVGGIPLNNDLALIFKQYSIHHLIVQTAPFPIKPLVKGIGCCGKNAMVNVHGVIYFISTEPRMYVTDGYVINLADPEGRLDDIWDGINKDRLQYIQGHYDPINDLIHWICSDGSATSNDLDIMWDLKHKCWMRNTTGFDCNVVNLSRGYLFYGGHTDGKIYEKYTANIYNDASETSPGAINAYLRTPWIKGTSNDTVINPHSMTINLKTQTSGNIKYSYGFNYNKDVQTSQVNQEQVGGKWGVDTWDSTFIWGGQTDSQEKRFIRGRGNNFQVKIFNDTVSEKMKVNSLSFLIKEQGIKEITNV